MNHEEGIANFIYRPKQQQYRELLRSKRTRGGLLDRMTLGLDFDERFLLPLQSTQQNAEAIERVLRARGAPETCSVISSNPRLDACEVPLRDALLAVVGKGFGTFLSCLPGKLAYFEGTNAGERALLSLSFEPRCLMRGTREAGSPLWSFYFINEGFTPFESVDFVAVKYEWGDEYMGGEPLTGGIVDMAPRASALVWQDDGASEMRTDLWIRLTDRGLDSWLLFEFPKLYRQEGIKLSAGPHRMPGPPPV
jgi:hypothetical protein